MKITFLSPPPNLSGGERVIAIYARELIKLGHQVEIVCSRKSTPSWKSRLKQILTQARFKQTPEPPSHYEIYDVPFRIVAHAEDVRETDLPDADVLIATFWPTAYSMQHIGPSKGAPLYLVQHDEEIFQGQAADATYQFPMQHVYVSNWIADRIRQRHPQAKGITIPNAVDVVAFEQGPRQMPEETMLGMMWSTVAFKNSQLAIDAVVEARRQGAQFGLVAFSAQQPTKEALSAIQTFAYCPSQAQIAEIYGSCTAWLFSSDEEGFGLPILESMAAGTPVIGTRTGAAPELIGNISGILVPTGDVDAMADAIVRFCHMSSSDWSRMSAAAYKTAASHTWPDAAKQLDAVLRDVIAGRKFQKAGRQIEKHANNTKHD